MLLNIELTFAALFCCFAPYILCGPFLLCVPDESADDQGRHEGWSRRRQTHQQNRESADCLLYQNVSAVTHVLLSSYALSNTLAGFHSFGLNPVFKNHGLNLSLNLGSKRPFK